MAPSTPPPTERSPLAIEIEPMTPPRARAAISRLWRKKLLYTVAAREFLDRRRRAPLGWADGSRMLVAGSWLNALFPVALLLPLCRASAPARFTLALVAMLPCATLLGDLTEKVAFHTSDAVGGLLNATFGNATEVIVSVSALRRGLVRVVQASLLGSVLSNMLLVLGSAFVAGGVRAGVARFDAVAASANTNLLLVAVLALAIPQVLVESHEIKPGGLDAFSRLTALLLLAVYGLYVAFQLSPHAAHLFQSDDPGEDEAPTLVSRPSSERFCVPAPAPSSPADVPDLVLESMRAARAPPFDELLAAAPADPDGDYVLSLRVACGWLAGVTVAIALLSDVVTGAIEGAADAWGVNDAFVGFVLLPIAGNAAEHATAILMGARGKMDLAVAVALGSSTQIALFALPLMVVASWFLDDGDDATPVRRMDLACGTYKTVTVLVSVVIVAFQATLGEATALTGATLIVAYSIVALSLLFITTDP